MKKKALFILANGVEELEAIAPIDLLRRADVDVTLASVEESLELTGRNQIKLVADVFLRDCAEEIYKLIVLPGGPGHVSLRKNELLKSLLLKQAEAGRKLAAICAAPIILKDLGLLEDRSFTAHYSMKDVMSGLIEDQAVVIDGNVITSRGAGTANIFGLRLIEELCGKETAANVAEDIHWEGLFKG